MAINRDGMHPRYLGWQVDWPIFVKVPFTADGKYWKKSEHFNWAERNLEMKDVASLYAQGFVYHNTELNKANKVGDRLSEMNAEDLKSVVTQLNAIVKDRTSSNQEFNNKKCKQSKIEDKQRGLIRRFLNHNPWITEDFYTIRDTILGD